MQKTKENPDSKYMLYSDRHMENWPDYELNFEGALIPKKDTPTVNFELLKKLLLAKADDTESKSQLEKLISSKKLQFLDSKTSMKGNRVALASYPRSGNSMSRKIIE